MANPILDSLTAYIQQERLPLINKAMLKGKSVSLFNLMTGVKTEAALNLLSTDVKFQDGLTCGFTEQGTQTLSQRILKTANIKINMSYCDRAMLKYWTQYALRTAAGEEKLPFAEEFVADVIKNVQSKVEKLVWQGDTTSDDTDLKLVDGLLKQAGADPTVIKVDITGTDAKADIMAVYNKIPAEILDEASIFVGADTFRSFVQELVNANLYHYSAEPVDGEIVLPGTNVKVIAVNGLNGTKKIFAARAKDIYAGVDMEGDEEQFDLWYSKDHQEYRLAIKFNIGATYAFGDQVVLGKTA